METQELAQPNLRDVLGSSAPVVGRQAGLGGAHAVEARVDKQQQQPNALRVVERLLMFGARVREWDQYSRVDMFAWLHCPQLWMHGLLSAFDCFG